MTSKNNIRPDFIVSLFLVLLTLGVYWQVRHHEFISFDDNTYVTENHHVRTGLTLENILWAFAFSDKEGTYWHPLTWLSHMLDCHLYGLNPGMHHTTNLIFHIANTLLLFLVFKRMTRETWQSAFVAALFALHPLNADSVAWVAERKNVLSTFFWMLTMLAYVRYAEQPGFLRYMSLLSGFVLGLLSKPMLVTLPCVLLLLDHWPLRRFSIFDFRFSTESRILWEKLPLFALSVASVCLSSLSLQHHKSIISSETVSMALRIENALVSYVCYIWKMIWPQNLAFYYPYPESLPIWQSLGAALLLAIISFLTIRTFRQMPYLMTGWLWYVGTLVPVSGLIQTGLWPAMADRWAYIPLIGLFIMIAWGVPDLMANLPRTGARHYKKYLPIAAAMILSFFIVTTYLQVRYWRNSVTLFEHALEVTDDNYPANNNLGVVLHRQGRITEAINHYSEALRLKPDDADTYNNMGAALAAQGKTDEAIQYYSDALRLAPGFATAYNNMGNALKKQGRTEEAIQHYAKALRLSPDYAEAHTNLGVVLYHQGKQDEAIAHFRRALQTDPAHSKARNNLGGALFNRGRIREAAFHFQRVLETDPDNADARNNLKKVLALPKARNPKSETKSSDEESEK